MTHHRPKISALSLLLAAGAFTISAAHAPQSHAQDFHAERAQYIAATSAVAYGNVERDATEALARFYWNEGLLPETAAALAALPNPDAHPLTHMVAVARGLAPPSVLNPRVRTDNLAAFIAAGRRAELAPNTRMDHTMLDAAVQGIERAPDALIARFTPALTQSAAASRHRPSMIAFSRAGQRHADNDAAAFIRGRVAEASGDNNTARRHYETAASGSGAWAAEARLRRTAMDWADGQITPLQAAQDLQLLLVDWPDDAFASRTLLALARANEFAGRPDRAADALALSVSRYTNTPHAPSAKVAANRLDDILSAIYTHNRYPELGEALRIEIYARTRPYAPIAIGHAQYDADHLDDLLAAGLYTEVLALTDPARGWPVTADAPAFARRLAAIRSYARQPGQTRPVTPVTHGANAARHWPTDQTGPTAPHHSPQHGSHQGISAANAAAAFDRLAPPALSMDTIQSVIDLPQTAPSITLPPPETQQD